MPDAFTLPTPPNGFTQGRDDLVAALSDAVERGATKEAQVDEPVQLILTDIEGCLNFDPLTYDHVMLAAIRRANEQASFGNAIPHMSLCTGRQAPFVDAFTAFLGVRVPVIFEGGSGLFFPTNQPGRDRTRWHPAIAAAEDSGDYAKLQEVVLDTAKRYGASQSLGKGRLLTFHGTPDHDVDELLEAFSRAISAQSLAAEVTRSANAVDISVPGVTKGSAVEWLLEVVSETSGTRWHAEHVVGIGDAPNDLPFLEVIGRSVAPINARDEIKRTVDHVSNYSDAKAVAEALLVAIDHNLGVTG